MQAKLVRREHGVAVAADAVEGHVAQIEQAGVADHHIQAQRQQPEQADVAGDADDILVAGQQRDQRRRDDQHAGHQQRVGRLQALQRAPERAQPRAARGELLDPLVLADFVEAHDLREHVIKEIT